jgi:hypothetical protein
MSSSASSTNGKAKPKQRPVHEVRLGRVRAAIWENRTDNGPRHNVTISRLYKDEETNQWKDSASFGRDDLHLVGTVSQMAELWIYSQAAAGAASPTGDDDEVQF